MKLKEILPARPSSRGGIQPPMPLVTSCYRSCWSRRSPPRFFSASPCRRQRAPSCFRSSSGEILSRLRHSPADDDSFRADNPVALSSVQLI
ncbi:MAG: hypothetical protein ACLRSW_05585 [Christensenellaceae bacterium]